MKVIKGIIQRKFSCMVAGCCTFRTPFLNTTFFQNALNKVSGNACIALNTVQDYNHLWKKRMKDVRRELRQGEKQCWERWCGGSGLRRKAFWERWTMGQCRENIRKKWQAASKVPQLQGGSSSQNAFPLACSPEQFLKIQNHIKSGVSYLEPIQAVPVLTAQSASTLQFSSLAALSLPLTTKSAMARKTESVFGQGFSISGSKILGPRSKT